MRRCLVILLAVWVLVDAGQAQAQGPGTTPELPQIGGSSSIMGNAPGAGGGSFSNLPGTGGY
ncbi:MAG: hypothetical protein ACXWOV_00425, partial [Isosphaeraceae bacterium]